MERQYYFDDDFTGAEYQAIPLAAALVVRFGVEGAGEVLTWWLIAGLVATFFGFYVLIVCNGMLDRVETELEKPLSMAAFAGRHWRHLKG